MLANYFIRRPIVAMVIAIITVIAGLLAMRALPLAQFPDIVPPQIIVSATYTGADAVTIEESVATPHRKRFPISNALSNSAKIKSVCCWRATPAQSCADAA